MAELEKLLQKHLSDNLQRISDHYGTDEDKWRYEVSVEFRCRANRGEGLAASDLKADLMLGKKTCPIKGKTVFCVRVPHPASNTAGAIVAKKYPDVCPLCKLGSMENDFDID